MPVALMVAGSEMVSFTVVGLLLDWALGTMPWCTVVLTLLGLAAAFFMLIRLSKALGARKPEPDGEGGP